MNGTAFANRHCHQRDVEHRQRIHRKRLKNMRSISKSKSPFQKVKLDLSPPNQPAFLKENRSKKQHQNQRIREIEHDNRVLLKKMAEIMLPRNSDQLQEYLPGVRLTASGAPVIDNFVSTTSVLPGSGIGGKRKGRNRKGRQSKKSSISIGALARKREMERIITENLAMLDRINNSKTSYSKRRLKREYASARTYRNLCSIDGTAGFLPKRQLPSIRAQTSPTGFGRNQRGLGRTELHKQGTGRVRDDRNRSEDLITLAFEKRTPIASSDGAIENYMVKVFVKTSERNPLVKITMETRRDLSNTTSEQNDSASENMMDTMKNESTVNDGDSQTMTQTVEGVVAEDATGSKEDDENEQLKEETITQQPEISDESERPKSERRAEDDDAGDDTPLLLSIEAEQLKFFVPVARRQYFFTRENMPELFDFLLSRLEVANLDDGNKFLYLTPCCEEERVIIGLEPIIVHRTNVEIPVRSMATNAEPTGDRVAMVVDIVFRGGAIKITGYDIDNNLIYECPQKVKYREEIIETGRDMQVVQRLMPTLALKVSMAQRGNRVLVLDTTGVGGPQH